MRYRLMLTSFIFVLFSFTASAQSNTNDLNDYELNGKVKTLMLTEPIYPIVYDAFNQPLTRNTHVYTRFNEAGYILENSDQNGKTTFDYFAGGDKLRSKMVDKSWKGKDTIYTSYFWYTYGYNEKGNLSEETQYNSDGAIIYRTRYHYNETGNLIKKQEYNPEGIYSSVAYQYDEKGNNTAVLIYNSENERSADRIKTFTYNPTGKLVTETDSIHYRYGSKTTYDYDEHGNLIEKKDFSPNDNKVLTLSSIYNYKYDAQGNLIEENISRLNNKNVVTHSSTYSYKYDALGNKIAENRITPEAKAASNHVYVYKYDKMNNWVKWTEYKDNKRIHVKKRKLTYYR